MILGNGAGFDYLVDVLVNLDLNVVKFLCRIKYGLYMIFFTRYCLLKFMLLDLFYHEKVLSDLLSTVIGHLFPTMGEAAISFWDNRMNVLAMR
jgi:hypothetical protein